MSKEVKVTRVFNAPIESVWKVWTEPELVMRWWGPDMFTCPRADMDFKEGGTTIVAMRAPVHLGGQDMFSIWQYTKIVPLESIEFIQNLAYSDGTKAKPADLGMPPDFPEDIRTLVTFKSMGNKTEMTVIEFADMGSMSKFAQMGLEQSIDKAAAIFE